MIPTTAVPKQINEHLEELLNDRRVQLTVLQREIEIAENILQHTMVFIKKYCPRAARSLNEALQKLREVTNITNRELLGD